MNVICIENTAFYALIDTVIARIKEKQNNSADKWISTDEAMTMLRITSKTTLQKLRDEGKIRASQPGKRTVLYDRDSIIDYLEDFTYETFDMK
ncbi:helix-turn-helix domain-containing protein [Mucilaginibacter flavidus]|uniref:helix-turn-helix domain-containing protein n=1 Tax=Mucilaginibacter flavidus TaxID=2949309 RepID=UPI002092E872|nr:helix-turn-helix domain-containing protein [Mucilaginibacter flavidus]MCO5946714.1 helix-turn-helix domain-containing protein [Mucilaginibacter flavidus]